MISKDLFKSHPIPFQAAFRTNPRHLFHFCVICIFKGYKLSEAAKDTEQIHTWRFSVSVPLPWDHHMHLIHTCVSEGRSHARHSIKSATVHLVFGALRPHTHHPPGKMGLINIFLWIRSPQVCLVTLTHTQISAALAIYSAAVAAASISDTGFTMIYEPAHWPSLFWKEKRGHIPSYMYVCGTSIPGRWPAVSFGENKITKQTAQIPCGRHAYNFSIFWRTGQRTAAIMEQLPKWCYAAFLHSTAQLYWTWLAFLGHFQ